MLLQFSLHRTLRFCNLTPCSTDFLLDKSHGLLQYTTNLHSSRVHPLLPSDFPLPKVLIVALEARFVLVF
jgi:hypothetical protein